MRQFGIIGKPLEHSYSAIYFTDKFVRENIDAEYKLYEIDDLSNINSLIKQLYGFNVTYPYKQLIINKLQNIDDIAAKIGAVNVVCKGKGYNTDWIGFRDSILPYLGPNDTHALILGTGGVSKAVQYALQQMGIQYTLVSRHAESSALRYENLSAVVIATHTLIINCTPLGMYPDINSLPTIPYGYIDDKHLLYDCVYNPACTAFLQSGIKQGARIVNGMQMLRLQADAAWKIWSNLF